MEDLVLYGTLPTEKTFLLAVVMEKYFCGYELKLSKIQQHEAFFPVDEHLINIFSSELRQALKTIVSDPFCNEGLSGKSMVFAMIMKHSLVSGLLDHSNKL